MPYTGNPATNLADQVRLNVGDIYPDMEMLDDATYAFFLSKYSNNVNRASIDAARSILFKLARYSRERTGDIEVFGSDFFKNYRAALTDFIRNPNLSVSVAMPYAGGISKKDMAKNSYDDDVMQGRIKMGLITKGIADYRTVHVLDNPSYFDGNDLHIGAGGIIDDQSK